LSSVEGGAELLDHLGRAPNESSCHAELHLATSVRSFRAENIARLVDTIISPDVGSAEKLAMAINERYPIRVTRCLGRARDWLRDRARGSERRGIVASSRGHRLKPHALDIRYTVDPVHWFLNDEDDTRSSQYLEDVATEFQVQGLELDWVCVAWDGDLRFDGHSWSTHAFKGARWESIRKPQRKKYLLNSYRVLLTRARQGFVIFVPPGDAADHTRPPSIYDQTFDFLRSLGIQEL
jgi:hypothetical protein